MKKLIALLLAVMMVLALCACGSENNVETEATPVDSQEEIVVSDNASSEVEQPTETTETVVPTETEDTTQQNWEFTRSVDDFGDVVEGGTFSLRTPIIGDFSNTATLSSELTGYVFISSDNCIVFRLFEYGQTPTTYSSTEGLVLKTKVNDTITEYSLNGTVPNGDLILGPDYDTACLFLDTLYYGDDIRCIIEIGGSQYNFTLESGNFAEAYEEFNNASIQQAEERVEANAVNSTADVLSAFFNKEKYDTRYAYIMEHIDDYPVLTNDEVSNIIVNSWLAMPVKDNTDNDWWRYTYTADGVCNTDGKFTYESFYGDYVYEEYDVGVYAHPYTIENDMVNVFVSATNTYNTELFREMAEGYYLVEKTNGSTSKTSYLIYAIVDEEGQPSYPIK